MGCGYLGCGEKLDDMAERRGVEPGQVMGGDEMQVDKMKICDRKENDVIFF